MIALLLGCAGKPPPPPPPPTIGEKYGDAQYLTPIDAPPTVALLAGGTAATTAESCGSCHTDHYAEWAGSTHARATRDLQFTAELSKARQPRWLCLNCHAPTRPQRWTAVTLDTRFLNPYRIDRISEIPEPLFDAPRVAEGVTCATCHVRRDADGEGIVIGPRGSGRAPHRVRQDPDALHGICVSCHSPDAAPISPTFVCWFETAKEIAASSTPDAQCWDCHMPKAERAAAQGAPAVELRRHLWLGGGVPKTFDGYARLAADGYQPAVDVAVALDPLRVTLTNARAAHLVPTGDPERHLSVSAVLEDADGKELARDTLRIGQKWDWGDEETQRYAKRLEDNRLLPGEAREWRPTLPAGGARVRVEVAHVRLTAENAAGMKGAQLDDELRRLHPEASAELPDLERFYPLETVFYREVVGLDGSARVVTPLGELLAER